MASKHGVFPIIERLGGPETVWKRLQEIGFPLRSKYHIWKWTERGTLPGPIIIALMRLAEAGGLAYRSEDFELHPHKEPIHARNSPPT